MQLVDPPGGRPWALLGLCAASLVLNVVLLTEKVFADTGEVAVAAAEPAPGPGTGVVVVETQPEPEPEPLPPNTHAVTGTVEHSLARTFQDAAPEHADVLAQVYARLYFWELDLRRDLQKGDTLAVLYEWDGELADIGAARYDSGKLGRSLRAYRFQATGDLFPSWWDAEGQEVPMRLEESPLTHYEQVTSLVKDGRGHKGMDFKVPVGTDVVAPRAGTVVRSDWNVAYNGNCVEMRYDDGTLARFLHLSETAVRPGERVARGERIGASGNTGRSTAPHLHYELERRGEVVDPGDYHGLYRRELPGVDRAGFVAEMARLDGLLASDA